jgi:hypothetical protein
MIRQGYKAPEKGYYRLRIPGSKKASVRSINPADSYIYPVNYSFRMQPSKKEVWLRGPLPGMHPLLQPVAQALLQAREELAELLIDFDEATLWTRPAGVASAGFHLQHLSGVLDRLFTYARGESLTEAQLEALSLEGKPRDGIHSQHLLALFSRQVDLAMEQLASTPEAAFTATRGVGRQQIPSTVIGLYVHAAEHTMRHVGQLLVTVRVQRSRNDEG